MSKGKWIMFTKLLEFKDIFVQVGKGNILDCIDITKDIDVVHIFKSPYKRATIRIYWRYRD